MLDPDANEVAERLAEVRARLDVAAAGRSVQLVAVAKRQPEARVEAALAVGQRLFGENYVQEAARRWSARRENLPDLRLHLVGPLQTNKAKDAVALFDVVQTLDRPKLAHALARAAESAGRCPELLIEVNTGEEVQKAGVPPGELEPLLRLARDELRLPVVGLMCIPPADEQPALHFALLRKLAERHGLPELSMGMSDDYEVAAAFGATLVRVGTAVFGPRPTP